VVPLPPNTRTANPKTTAGNTAVNIANNFQVVMLFNSIEAQPIPRKALSRLQCTASLILRGEHHGDGSRKEKESDANLKTRLISRLKRQKAKTGGSPRKFESTMSTLRKE